MKNIVGEGNIFFKNQNIIMLKCFWCLGNSYNFEEENVFYWQGENISMANGGTEN